MNSEFNVYNAKRRIISSIKDLDKSDYNDICTIIKNNTTDTSMVNITVKGTYINLDKINNDILRHLDQMVQTKLQRIALQK